MNMFEAKKEADKLLGESMCKTLESRGFKACYAADGKEACEIALGLIDAGSSVGIPGSVTVRQIGLPQRLEEEKGCKINQHWKPGLSPQERKAVLVDEFNSDWFVTSANALSKDGTIVNIDGTGNRVSAMAWAPGKIIYIISINKITEDTASAIQRVKDRTAPANALRLGSKTACSLTGRCVDCKAPTRICRVTTLTEYAPLNRECHVILVGEELGY